MNMMKRLRSLLILLLLLSTLMVWASAETSGSFNYSVNKDGETATITGANGAFIHMEIPSVVDGYTVTAIGNSAFWGWDSLISVTLPDTVTVIQPYAFYSCKFLNSVKFSANLKEIRHEAFELTALKELDLPDGLTALDEACFGRCYQLTSVSVPESLTTIYTDFVPTTTGPFYGCDNLNSFTFRGNRTSIPFAFFASCSGLKEIVLPETVTSMGEQAFKGCPNLQSVTLPNGLTSIPNRAFEGCGSLTSISIPDAATQIGENAFGGCTSLAEIRFSEETNLTTIGITAFQKAAVTALVLPDGLTSLGEDCFGSCSQLTSVSVPESLTSVVSASSATTIGPFHSCDSLNRFTFRGTRTSIPFAFFANCTGLKNIALPKTVTAMGNQAFKGCTNLQSVTLPNGLTAIPNRAFEDCKALTTVHIPDSVSTIGEQAFFRCTSLRTIRFSPAGNLTAIGNSAFEQSGLQSLRLPEGVKSLGTAVAKSCKMLTDVCLPGTLTSQGNSIFEGCSALKKVTFGECYKNVPQSGFRYCTALEQIVFPESLTKINYLSFDSCTNLTAASFLGDAPAIEISKAFPSCTTLYYMADRAKWTTPYYPGPNVYPSCPIWGEVDLSDQDYFAKLADHHFKFRDPAGNPLTNVTVVFGAETHSSGENAEITARFADDAVTELTFEKEGYFSVTLPLEVLEGISVIRLYPETWDEPYIQAAYAKNAADGSISDLLNGGWILTEMDADTRFSFYVQTNWLEENPTCITLSKSPTITGRLLELNDGWNEAVNVSATLQADSKLYLLQTAENIVELSVVIIECDPEIQMDMGDVFDLSRLLPVTMDINVLNELDLGFDFTDEVNIDFQVNDDCTFTGVLGVQVYDNPSVDNDTYKTWNDEIYAKIHDGAVKDKDNLLGASSVKSMQNLGVTPIPKRGKFVIDSEVRLLGYVNGMFIKNDAGKIVPFFTEVGVGAGYSGAVTQSWQFPVGGQPHYSTIAFKGDAQVLVNFYKGYYGEKLEPKPFNFSLETTLEPRYGIGWDSVLNAGVRGTGTLKSELSIPVTKERGSAKVNASIYAEASFFALHANIPLLELDDIQLNPYFLNFNSEAPMQSLSLPLATPETQWEPQSMDYLYGISLLDVGEDNTDTNVTTLASGVYPYAEAELAVLPDGTELAVWVAHGDNEPNNRTRLYYSCTVDGSWTSPAPVDSTDTTADFTPLLQVENGIAYLVWQDAARPLTNSNDVVSMASTMDVSVARFNGEGFDLLGSVGNEATYDGAVSLTTMDGQLTVVWASNSSNNLFSNSSLTSGLHRACWNGESWTSETLVENLGAVDQTAAWNNTVWFSANADASGNPLRRELYRFEGTLTQLTENEVVDSKPEVVNGKLVWFSGDMLTDGEQEIPMEKVTDRYQYLQNGAMEALVYVVNDSEQQSGIYASFNDGSGWGEPIALTGGTTNIGSFSARFLTDGSLAVLALERSSYLDEDNHIGYSAGTLNRYTVEIFGDLALEEADYLATTLLPNNDLTVNLLLNNNGMVHTKAVEITVSDGKTALIKQAWSAELASGVSDAVSLNVPLGETVPDGLTVTVNPIGYTDANEADNTAELVLHCTDLSVEEALATSGDTTSVTVMVANRGLRDIDSADVNLTDAEGNVLDNQTVTGLAVRSAQFVEFTLEETFADNTLLYVQVPEVGTENLISNNRIAVLVQGKQTGSITEDLTAAANEAGVEVTVILTNSTDAATVGSYVCAAYDGSGKMLTSFTKLSHTVLPGRTSYLTETFPKETAKVKLFRLDADFCPADTVLEKEISQ